MLTLLTRPTTGLKFRLYFAWAPAGGAVQRMYREWEWAKYPLNLLVSFYYMQAFEQRMTQDDYGPDYTMLDSGAFSAWQLGKTIDLDALIEETKNPRWTESVTLDDIRSHAKSRQNSFAMKERGSPAYPVFHFGEPWHVLEEYCQNWPKVGLSCLFGEARASSFKWLDQCFAREWPHRFHSFGWVSEPCLFHYPFESADASSYAMPQRYGRSKKYGMIHTPSKLVNLKDEVFVFLDLEARLRARWNKELAKL